MKSKKFNIGTFNVRGLTSDIKKESLNQDIEKLNVDVCCLQETKIKKGIDINVKNNRLICFPSEKSHYGNGFLIKSIWKENIHKFWKLSERICVLQLKMKHQLQDFISTLDGMKMKITKGNTNIYKSKLDGMKMKVYKAEEKHIITIINVYAPTTTLIRKDNTILDELYLDLGNLINEQKKNSTMVILAGDFNAKVGKRRHTDINCLGKFSRGRTNNSGKTLIDFCSINHLFISNSAFQHPARHITTWESQIKVDNKIVKIYNQIDYIICQENQKHLLCNSRSYSNTLTNTDHRIVVTEMNIQMHRIYKKDNKRKEKPFNSQLLTMNEDIRNQYKNELRTKIEQQIEWNDIQKSITSTAQTTIGYLNKVPNSNNIYCDNIAVLSQQQKHLRLKISNCKKVEKVKIMKAERNKILHQIQHKVKEHKEQLLNNKLSDINDAKGNAQMFKAVKILNRKQYENPSIHDKKGKSITNKQEIHNVIKEHFSNHFVDNKITTTFQMNKHQLENEISNDEVKKSISKLNNNRAPGYDKITAEMIKYGPEELHQKITTILNNCVSNNIDIKTGFGLLAPLQKPGKTRGPVINLRPVILLPIIRKILSNVVLSRIKPKVDEYLSLSQSAYREKRSTGDIVWAYRWIIAKAQKEKEKIYITGIDLSSAFDTIIREKLVIILERIIDKDELQMVKFLLKDTKLQIKMSDVEPNTFDTNIGSPQGDGLSGVLFNIYFENSLRKLRDELDKISPELPTIISYQNPPGELQYADDGDFITKDQQRDKTLNAIFSDILLEDNLKSNTSKTEHTIIERGNNGTELWRNVKKLGSLLGDKEDINRRKQLCIISMNKYETLWIKKEKLNENLRIELYDKLIKPVLLYNSSTWGLTANDELKLDTFHRKQLRRVIGKRYPDKISNKKLYEKCKTYPISLHITELRWQKFGHILRLNSNTPAYKSMLYYFTTSSVEFYRGADRTTIVTTLNRDINKS